MTTSTAQFWATPRPLHGREYPNTDTWDVTFDDYQNGGTKHVASFSGPAGKTAAIWLAELLNNRRHVDEDPMGIFIFDFMLDTDAVPSFWKGGEYHYLLEELRAIRYPD